MFIFSAKRSFCVIIDYEDISQKYIRGKTFLCLFNLLMYYGECEKKFVLYIQDIISLLIDMEDKIIIRIEETLKDEYRRVCRSMGINMSEDIRNHIDSMIEMSEDNEDV